MWLRAPYLHNGSVPNVRELLQPAARRSSVYQRGCDVYDQKNLGFVSNVANQNGRALFDFDTTQRGNSNSGHEYGVDLPDKEKEALLEYLKLR